jgi:hypothetical protein
MWVLEGYLGTPIFAEIPKHKVHLREGRLITDPIVVVQPDPDGSGKDLKISHRYVYEVSRPMTVGFRNYGSETENVF